MGGQSHGEDQSGVLRGRVRGGGHHQRGGRGEGQEV